MLTALLNVGNPSIWTRSHESRTKKTHESGIGMNSARSADQLDGIGYETRKIRPPVSGYDATCVSRFGRQDDKSRLEIRLSTSASSFMPHLHQSIASHLKRSPTLPTYCHVHPLSPWPSMPHRPANASAFTLFEIALSLALLSISVISVMMIFPVGLRTQQMSRFQLYASAKAEEMVEQFSTAHFDNATADTEGPTCWEAASSYRSQTWDLDARISSHRYGMMPLPLDLAKRLDSNDDEIARILAEGGYVYYSQPLASTGTEEQGQAEAPPNEAQKLIIGITGYAQQNAMPIFPMKNWPYMAASPSPPMHFAHMLDSWLPAISLAPSVKNEYFDVYQFPGGGESFANFWESTRINGQAIPGTDVDMQKVVDWPESGVRYGYVPYAFTAVAPTQAGAIRYVQSALWYCKQKVPDPTFWDSTNDIPQLPTTVVPSFISGTAPKDKWKQVQAMRFLSHAATCLTSWFSLSNGSATEDLTRGVKIAQVTLDGIPGPADLLITNNLIHYYHERSVKLTMEFAANYPYDWAIPRPIERTIMVDYPLLQYDMFSAPISGTIFGTAGIPAAQWRPLSPRPIRNIGLSSIYPVNVDPGTGRHRLEGTTVPGTTSNLFGNLDHYSLAMPFNASERCREIVFWTADWQSYEDFETQPSAPLDASRYPICGPRQTGAGANPAGAPRDFNGRMGDVAFVDPHLFCFRNPEKAMLWFNPGPMSAVTGTDVTADEILNSGGLGGAADQGSGLGQRMTFSGRYGADRNFNKKIDRGPLPRSVRLRAVEVARFNFYDPRIPCLLR